jgi:hypothetical protein
MVIFVTAVQGLFALCLLNNYSISVKAGKVTSNVQIHLPKELQRENGYDHREALFGLPPYGASIIQNVYYSTSNPLLCEPLQSISWKSPFILLIDRGGCSFVQKVRNAQHSGAAAVIIADSQCQCKAKDICTSEPGMDCEDHEPIMADDGSGYDITIPSVLLFKQDADPIKAVLTAGQAVRAELAWPLPHDDHVEYELWSSPTDWASREFKLQFKEAAMALGNQASFTPHFYIYDGIESMCRDDKNNNVCDNLCTNVGRYCATDPDNDLNFGISGADVVKESLRRKCIWDIYGKDNGIGVEWWDYVAGFETLCDTSDLFMKDDCVKKVMSSASVDYDEVEKCIESTGGLEKPAKNSFLEEELAAKADSQVVILPVAYVNGVPLRGGLEFATVFKAICAGYPTSKRPPVCTECANCSDEKACVESGQCKDKSNGGVDQKTFAASLAGVTIFFSLLAIIQYVRSQRLMRAQVRGILAEYMPLEKEGMNGISTAIEQDDDGEFT